MARGPRRGAGSEIAVVTALRAWTKGTAGATSRASAGGASPSRNGHRWRVLTACTPSTNIAAIVGAPIRGGPVCAALLTGRFCRQEISAGPRWASSAE